MVVSSVVLCQSGYVATGLKFVGQFEILQLSGSFSHREAGGKNRRMGKLSISLAKPDGQVFGGVVVGPPIVATPIQLIVATFKQNVIKEYKRRQSTDSLLKANKLRDLQMLAIKKEILSLLKTKAQVFRLHMVSISMPCSMHCRYGSPLMMKKTTLHRQLHFIKKQILSLMKTKAQVLLHRIVSISMHCSFFFYGELYSLEKTYRDSQAYPHNPPYGHNVIKSSG
ncbi:hypothetical protein ACOSP7_016215 [Xanthoceras sorbifolium]